MIYRVSASYSPLVLLLNDAPVPVACHCDPKHCHTNHVPQDASELLGYTSLREVPSAASVSSSSRPGGPAAEPSASRGAVQHQASSVSAATYEEDFEDGEASELQQPSGAGVGLSPCWDTCTAEAPVP